MGERLNGIQEVDGSIPSGSTKQNNGLEGALRDAFSFATFDVGTIKHGGPPRLLPRLRQTPATSTIYALFL